MSGPVKRGKFPFGRPPTPMAQPGKTLQLGAPQINFVRQVAVVSGLPPAAVLNLMVDSAAYHGKAGRVDALFAAWISQIEAQQAAAAPPPPDPPASEEMVEGTAEDRLKAHREAAGMTIEAQTGPGEGGVGIEPVTGPAQT